MIERSRGPRSRWAPYINSLPRSYDDPLWWRAAARRLLEGSRAGAAADAAERALERLARLREKLVEARARELLESLESRESLDSESESLLRREKNPLAALSGSAAAEDARWARSSVWSRAFNLPPAGSRRVTLLPVGDMLDHDPLVAVRWSAGGGGGSGGSGGGSGEAGEEEVDGNGGPRAGEGDFVFETLGGVPRGGAVSSNYGHKSNEELMVGYGFILPRNEADFFHFSLGIGGGGGSGGSRGRKDDRGARGRRARLVRLGVPLDAYCTCADPLPRSALVAACAALAEGAAGSALDEVEAPPPETTTETTPETTATAISAPPPCIEVRPAPPRAPPASTSTSSSLDDIGVPCPPETQLRAVAALRAALRARARELRGGGANGDGGGEDEDDEEGARKAEAAGDRHREMALRYRAEQRRLARGAEAALAAAATRAVSAAALTTARLFGFNSPGSAAAEDDNEDDDDDGNRAVSEKSAAALPPLLCEVGFSEGDDQIFGFAPPSASWTWGVSLPRGCRRGQVLAVVPGSETISAPHPSRGSGLLLRLETSRQRLAAALLCAAARAGLFGGDSGGGEEEEAEENCEGKRSALARRLAFAVPLPPSVRFSGGDGDEGERAAARRLLEGTALGEALLEQSRDLASEGALVVEAARAQLLLPPSQSPPPPLPEPGSRAAERAGAWSLSVVDSAAVPGPGGGSPVLAALASAVPHCFRGAAVDFEWVCSSCDEHSCSFSLVVRAAADLPCGGLELRRGCALVGQSAFDAAVAGGLEALPALLLRPEEGEKVPAGFGGKAVWHCFERELPSVGGLAAAEVDRASKKKRRKRKSKEDAGEDAEEEAAPSSQALSLARRAADACALLSSSSGAFDLLVALGRPTPRRALASYALYLIADGDDADEEEAATAALKRAGLKRLLRSRRAADAAAAAAAAARGAGRDDAALAALEAERASDAFIRGVLACPLLGGRARAALRRELLGEREALEKAPLPPPASREGGSEADATGGGLVAGARIYREGLLAALQEHAAALEKR